MKNKPLLLLFLFDFEGDLYGKNLSIQLLARIREEKNFESIEQLVGAMKKDESFCHSWIKENKLT